MKIMLQGNIKNIPEIALRIIHRCLFLLLMTNFALYAQQDYDIESKLLAFDGAAGDGVGVSVAISGNTVIVGAGDDDDMGSRSGSAYIFQFDDPGWQQQAKLTASDGAEGDWFGFSVAISGNTVIVGAAGDDDMGSRSGSAYIFQFDGSGWQQQAKLTASDGAEGDVFGHSVAISGNTVIVGAAGDDDMGSGSGSAYIFQFDGSGWQQQAKLTASDGAEGDQFGMSVAISGNTAIVGAAGDDDMGSGSGSAYIFQFDGSGWQQAKLTASDGAALDMFGISVAISGNTAIVGVLWDNDMGSYSGSAYIFQFDGSGWQQQAKLTASDGATLDMFGYSVDISGNTVIVGAYGNDDMGYNFGSAYIFQFDGSGWQQAKLTASDGAAEDFFGISVAISGNTVIVGAHGNDDMGSNSGSAYIYEFIARPGNVQATDGKIVTKITWDNRSTKASNYKIFRNNEPWAEVSATTNFYTDNKEDKPIPGKIYNYAVASYVNIWGESNKVDDYGWQMANGQISGQITSKPPNSSGVKDLKVNALCDDLCGSLQFDGIDDYVQIVHDPSLNPNNEVTIEAWVKPQLGTQVWSRIFSSGIDNKLELMALNDNQRRFCFYPWIDGSFRQVIDTEDWIPDVWYHVAGTYDGQFVRLFVNGILKDSSSYEGTLSFYESDPKIGWRAASKGEHFKGNIDEVRFWNIERSETQIKSDMNRILTGKEIGLVAFWRFDEREGNIIGDYAEKPGTNPEPGLHGIKYGGNWSLDDFAPAQYSDTSDEEGFYYLTNIYYDNIDEPGAPFIIRPDSSGGRIFNPDSAKRYLKYSGTSSDYQKGDVDFIDESAFAIKGHIKFADLSYYLKDVEINIDDSPNPVTYTDENGQFVTTLQTGQHNIKPSYYNHKFVPVDTTVFVNNPIIDLFFEDTTHHTLSIRVVGGQAGFDIGESTILINGPDNCFTRTIKTSQGHFQERLPALPGISVTITKIDDETVDLFLENHGGTLKTFKTISLVEGDSTLDFIYYAEPQVIIEGFPDPTTVYDVPVLEQFSTQSLGMKIIEDYGNGRICAADSGSLTIYNEISDDYPPAEIALSDSGDYNFTFKVGMPNILAIGSHPYQKKMQIHAATRGGYETVEQWTIVSGYRPREQTFTTVSPAIPLFILRDPPGDHSYSFLEQGSTISLTTSMSMLKNKERNTYLELKAGVAFSVSAGAFVSVSTGFSQWGKIQDDFTIGASVLNQHEQQLTMTNINRYKTSSEETGIGAGSDVYIGAALNIIYAIADILEVNELEEIELSKSIVYGVDTEEAFETTYIYTQNHVEQMVIPRLKENLALAADPDSVQYWNDQIEAWQHIIALNDSLKQNAEPLAGPGSDISISGGTEKYFSSTITQSASHSLDFNLYINNEVAFETGLDAAGSGFRFGHQVRTRLNFGKSTTLDTMTSNTVGYCIYDNEQIDNFWIKIKSDTVYGTPVFDLQEGCYSSQPWEPGTNPHGRCKLVIDGDYIQTDIDPNGEAVFTLELINTSPSGQPGSYKLFHIPTSNPDGAQLQIFGDPINTVSPFFLTAYQPASIPLAVKTGPYAYDYEDLKVALKSVVDEQIADTVTFSVHFTPPCSPVTLDQPEDGWIANKQLNDSLRVVLRDYDKSKMTSVILQYSPKNRNEWKEVFGVYVASLPSNNAELILSTKELKEGSYDIRAKVIWNQVQGVTYSQKASGIIDRIAPKIFGDPQPADGVLHPGDNISIKFNENIDKNAISTQNVTLQDAHNGAVIPIDVITDDREVIIMPKVSDKEIENKNLQVSVINICDQYGNSSGESIIWSFYVNKNPVFWNTSKISKTILEGETCKFWAKLSNNGGEDVNFNLSNISWLSADPQDGLINKGEEKIVNFMVDENIMSGYYLDTLFAETAKGNEPLILDMHVQNKPPQWTFDPTSFKYNMTITTGFYIDNTPFSEENDLVAAFIGTSICGKVKVQKVAPQDEYVAFLMVHSNYNRPDNVNLVLWDASEGQERTIAEQLTFVADTSYGRASSPDSLHIAGAFLQSIALSENWTWFSLGVEAKDMSVPAVLDGLRPRSGDLVKGHIAYTQYLPGTGWVGSLDTLRIGNGFKIKLSASRELDFIGDPVLDIHWPIEIIPGWNWIGYLPDETMDINYSLASLNPTAADGDQIKNKNSFASYNSIHSQWEGTLTHMKVGEGYQIKVANNGIIRYPGPSGKKISLTKILSAKSINSSAPDWSLDASDFEYTMNVTSTLSIDGLPVSNANTLIGAFINNVCCGVCKPVFVNDKWMYFSTIFSNNTSSDSIQFRVYDAENDQVRDVATKIEFVSDKVLGTPAAPLGLWIGIPTGIEEDMEIPKHFALEHNYPNPFNPKTTIRYALKQPEHVHLIVYDMLGKKVKDLVDMPQLAGWYEVDFNASNLASGVYFYKLVAGPFTKVRKMILIK